MRTLHGGRWPAARPAAGVEVTVSGQLPENSPLWKTTESSMNAYTITNVTIANNTIVTGLNGNWNLVQANGSFTGNLDTTGAPADP